MEHTNVTRFLTYSSVFTVMAGFAVATSPMPSSQFVCFFRNHDARLSPRERHIITKAIDNWQQKQQQFRPLAHSRGFGKKSGFPVKVEITGHAHEPGNDVERDKQLSLRRAVAVETEFVSQGIPASIMTAIGLGATQPLLIGEPLSVQNQFVEIQPYW